MKIANPLYDHAFKYLMSNDRLARKVLSVILDKEVLKLELSQQEIQDEDQRNKLMAEEELEQLFGMQEAEKAELLNMIEEAKAREEEAKAREEEAKAREEEAKAREAAAVFQARETKLKLARLMRRSGVSVEEIALETGLTIEEVNELPD
jgi:formate-dependent nitrite reductase cytochrome c552 subunit